MERRRIQLSEWRPAEVELSADDAARLGSGPGEISVDRLHEGRYRVTPSHWVGSIALGKADVVIRPKVGVQRLLHLLSYSPRLRFDQSQLELDAEDGITEAIVRAFLAMVVVAIRRGPLMGYQHLEEAGATVRGRIRLVDQARRRFNVLLPVEISYDDFTVDIQENRMLKAGLQRVATIRLRSEALRRGVTAALNALAEVADVRYEARDLPIIRYTRLNEHYESALLLARAILTADTPDLRHGRVATPTFVIDMDKVFEDFIFRAAEPHLQLAGMQWRQGKVSTFDQARRVRIKPDLTIWKGTACRFVGDVKYKRTKFGDNEDLYQVLAYAKALGKKDVLLIYAEAAEELDHIVRVDGTRIIIRTIDLDAPPAVLDASMETLANEIQLLASADTPQLI
jgi:5-methylcytosine-specific restriction enzyme subunit McrC